MSEQTIQDVVTIKYWEKHFTTLVLMSSAQMGAYDALRAVLRELEEVITEDDIDPDGLDLLVKRIRAAVGE